MKRYIKVILTTLLALSILLGAFAGCSNEKNDKKAEAEAKKIAMKTDNFSVSLGMMKYFYQVAYTSFVGDTYYNFLKAQCSLNNSKYGNQDLPLNQQKIGQGSYDAILVSNIENYKDKTWHDYFVDQATATVKETLIFCEMAKERNVSLTDDEKAEIQLEVKKVAERMKNTIDADGKMMYSGLSDDECFAKMFGAGVDAKTVTEALTLVALSEKANESLSDDIANSISLDRIEKVYSENPKQYDVVDFATYSYEVKYNEIANKVLAEKGEGAKIGDYSSEILNAYSEEIKKTAEKAKKLSEITDLDEFVKFIINDYIEENYEGAYRTAKTNKKLSDNDSPSNEEESIIKDAIKEHILKELLPKDAKSAALDDVSDGGYGTYSAYGVDGLTKNFGDFITEFKANFYGELYYVKASCVNEKNPYIVAEGQEEEEYQKWLYDSARMAGDHTIIENGDGANGQDIKFNDKNYTADVYLMLKPRYKDESNTCNGAVACFVLKDDAMAFIKALDDKGNIDRQTFLALAREKEAIFCETLMECQKGGMGSDSFDEWFFYEGRANGEYTKYPIFIGEVTNDIGTKYFETGGISPSASAEKQSEKTFVITNSDAYEDIFDFVYNSAIKEDTVKNTDKESNEGYFAVGNSSKPNAIKNGNTEYYVFVNPNFSDIGTDYSALIEGIHKGNATYDNFNFKPLEVKNDSLLGGYMVAYFDKVAEVKAWQAVVKGKICWDDIAAATESYKEKYSKTVVTDTEVLAQLGNENPNK